MAYKKINYGYGESGFKASEEYVADTFDELPTEAEFGDFGYFKEDNVLKIAIKFSDGWTRG